MTKMKRVYIYIIMCMAAMAVVMHANAQQRSGYFMDTYDMRHEMNPALQPDSSYWSLPLLGNTYAGMQSTAGMKDLLFEKADGTLTTFMTKGTIGKSELMDAVGNGMKTVADARLLLLGMGRRVSSARYQTAGISLRATSAAWLPRSLFDCMKDMENRDYVISRTKAKASLYVEVAAGESRKINERLTAGVKAKLLLGLMNMSAEMRNMHLDMSDGDTYWTASGTAELNVAGMKYKTEKKEYHSGNGDYQQVCGVDVRFPGINGIGAAIDAGITYKLNDRCTLSASLTDLGFITWTNNHKALNKGDTFRFDGFKDVSIEHDDANSLGNQWDVIHDDLMDLLHLEKHVHTTNTTMLGATFTLGAEYDLKEYSNLRTGVLLTRKVDGKYSWTELRMSGVLTPIRNFPLDVSISPAYSTFGFSGGMMANYYPGRNVSMFIGSDCIFTTITPQMIPTSLNGTIHLGMTIRM